MSESGFSRRGRTVIGPVKDPEAVLDYTVDWTDWLAGDTIISSTWIISAPELTKVNDSYDDNRATIWIKGGVAGQSYQVTNRITTGMGRVEDQTFWLPVEER